MATYSLDDVHFTNNNQISFANVIEESDTDGPAEPVGSSNGHGKGYRAPLSKLMNSTVEDEVISSLPMSARQSTIIDLRLMPDNTIKKRLKAMDVNKDNQVSLTEVVAAMKEKVTAEQDLRQAKQLIALLVVVVLIVVGATVGLTYVVVQKSITMTPSRSDPFNPVLADTSGVAIQVQAKVSSVNIPLGAFQLLPDLLYNLNQISYHEPHPGDPAQEVFHVMYVQSIVQHPSTNVNEQFFSIVCNDGTTVNVYGFINATVIKPGGGGTFSICAACSSCVYQSTPLTPTVKAALAKFNDYVPDVIAACTPIWVSSVPTALRRDASSTSNAVEAQISFCATCKEAVMYNAELAALSNIMSTSHVCGVDPFTNGSYFTGSIDDFIDGSGDGSGAGYTFVDSSKMNTACAADCEQLGLQIRPDLTWLGTCQEYKCVCSGVASARRRTTGTTCVGTCAVGYFFSAVTSTCRLYTVTCDNSSYWSNSASSASADRICTVYKAVCPVGTGGNAPGASGGTPTSDVICLACARGTFNTGSKRNCTACSSSCPPGTTGTKTCTASVDTTCNINVPSCATSTDPGFLAICNVVKDPGSLLIPSVMLSTALTLKNSGVAISTSYQLPSPCPPGGHFCSVVTKYIGNPSLVTTLSLVGSTVTLSTAINDIYFKYDSRGRPTVGLTTIGGSISADIPFPPDFSVTTSQTFFITLTFETGEDAEGLVTYTPGVPYPYINPLSFAAAITLVQIPPSIDPPSPAAVLLQLSGIMQGVWYQAFGLSFLSFQNIGLFTSFNLAAQGLPNAFGIAGSMFLGSCFISNGAEGGGYVLDPAATGAGNCVGATIAGGFDLLEGKPFFGFYASIALYGLQVKIMLNMLGVPANLINKLPKGLLESGFPPLFDSTTGAPMPNPVFSINFQEDTVTAADGVTEIPPGFFYSGLLNIWGYETSALVQFSPTILVFRFVVNFPSFRIQMPACRSVKMPGCGQTLLSVSRSSLGPAYPLLPGNGPIIDVNIDLLNDPASSVIAMNAKISVLGAEVEAALVITPFSFWFIANLTIFTYFDVFVNISANIKLDPNVPFNFASCSVPMLAYVNFSGSVINTITTAVLTEVVHVTDKITSILTGLSAGLGKASDAVSSANAKLKKAHDDCDQATNDYPSTLTASQNEINDLVAQANFANQSHLALMRVRDQAQTAFNNAQNAINNWQVPCNLRSCGNVLGPPYICNIRCEPIRCSWRGCRGGQCSHDTCRDTFPDLICQAENTGCKILRTANDGLKVTALALVQSTKDTVNSAINDVNNAANKLNNLVQVALPAANAAYNTAVASATQIVDQLCNAGVSLASDTLTGVQNALQDMSDIVNVASSKLGLPPNLANSIHVYSISVNTSLNLLQISSGSLVVSMVASILSAPVKTYSLAIDLKNLLRTAITFLKAHVPGFSSVLTYLNSIINKVMDYLPPNVQTIVRALLERYSLCGDQCPMGTGVNGIGGTPCALTDQTCGACPAGMFNFGDTTTCTQCTAMSSCPNGTGTNGLGGSACTVSSDAVCGTCNISSFNTGLSLTCSAYTATCVTGQYWSNSDSAAVANRICTAYQVTCPAGTYWTNPTSPTTDRTCSPCKRGSYSSVANSVTCTSYSVVCPADTFCSNAQSSINDCTCTACSAYNAACPPGTGVNGIGGFPACNATRDRVCGLCKDGTFNNGTSNTCVAVTGAPCIPGQTFWSPSRSTDRVCLSCSNTCPARTGIDGVSGSVCTPTSNRVCSGACRSNTRSWPVNSGNSLLCYRPCADNQWPITASCAFLPTCPCAPMLPCLAGFFWANYNNFYVDRNCVACTGNSYSNTANALVCSAMTVNCAPGTFWNNSAGIRSSDRTCASCPVGSYSSTSNSISCTLYTGAMCPPGQHWSNFGLRAISDRICLPCASGFFTSASDSPFCRPFAIDCPVGTYWSNLRTPAISDRVCTACLSGYFSTLVNSVMQCIPLRNCPPGTLWNNSPVSTAFDRWCVDCPVDSYSNVPNSLSCVPFTQTCSPGTFWSNPPTSPTTSLPSVACMTSHHIGCFQDLTDLGSRNLPFQVNNNSDNTVAGCMLACAGAGYDYAGLQNGGFCYCGTILNLLTQTLPSDCSVPCTASVSDMCGGVNRSSIYYTPPCTNASVAERVCLPCPAAQYSSSANTLACQAMTVCIPGQFWANFTTTPNPTFDSVACSPCAMGFFSSSQNAAKCTGYSKSCLPGSFWINSAEASTADRTCSVCPSGTFSTTANATSCSVYTLNCNPGNFWSNPSTTQDRICQQCPIGSFQNLPNQLSCTPYQINCQPGYPGTYWKNNDPNDLLSRISDRICARCLGNSFTGTINQASCRVYTTCYPGTYWANFGNFTADRNCVACASNSFTTTPNAPLCMVKINCNPPYLFWRNPGAGNTADRICGLCPLFKTTNSVNAQICR